MAPKKSEPLPAKTALCIPHFLAYAIDHLIQTDTPASEASSSRPRRAAKEGANAALRRDRKSKALSELRRKIDAVVKHIRSEVEGENAGAGTCPLDGFKPLFCPKCQEEAAAKAAAEAAAEEDEGEYDMPGSFTPAGRAPVAPGPVEGLRTIVNWNRHNMPANSPFASISPSPANGRTQVAPHGVLPTVSLNNAQTPAAGGSAPTEYRSVPLQRIRFVSAAQWDNIDLEPDSEWLVSSNRPVEEYQAPVAPMEPGEPVSDAADAMDIPAERQFSSGDKTFAVDACGETFVLLL
jgi:hypothetical protein